MSSIENTKQAWRQVANDVFALVGREDRRLLDSALVERLREIVFSRGAGFLLGFSPLTDEPDLSPFFRHWLADGGRLAMPVWLGGPLMQIREITDMDSQLRRGRAGIMEPHDDLPVVNPSAVDLAVIPGRAFSERRQRIGRGSGCYDRLLSGGPVSVGVAYDFQVVPVLPETSTDVRVDLLLTPSRLIMDKRRKDTGTTAHE